MPLANLIKSLFKKFGLSIKKIDYSAPANILDFLNFKDYFDEFIVLDVGANKGQTIEFILSKAENAKIYSFEPDPECVFILEEKYSSNENIQIIPVALADKQTSQILYRNQKSILNSLAPLNKTFEGRFGKERDLVNTKSITLDSYLLANKINNVNLLKIDVQGFEAKVIEGSRNSINNKVFEWIIVEITIGNVYKVESSFYGIQNILSTNYQLFSIMDYNYSSDFGLTHCDFVYKKIEDE